MPKYSESRFINFISYSETSDSSKIDKYITNAKVIINGQLTWRFEDKLYFIQIIVSCLEGNFVIVGGTL